MLSYLRNHKYLRSLMVQPSPEYRQTLQGAEAGEAGGPGRRQWKKLDLQENPRKTMGKPGENRENHRKTIGKSQFFIGTWEIHRKIFGKP